MCVILATLGRATTQVSMFTAAAQNILSAELIYLYVAEILFNITTMFNPTVPLMLHIFFAISMLQTHLQ